MLNLQVVQKILLVNQNCCPEVQMHASGDIRAQVRAELPKGFRWLSTLSG